MTKAVDIVKEPLTEEEWNWLWEAINEKVHNEERMNISVVNKLLIQWKRARKNKFKTKNL